MSKLLIFLVFAAGISGCGSPDGRGTVTYPQGGGGVEAFCDQTELLDGLDRPPNDEELDRLLETAPSEMRGDVEVLVESAKRFREDPDMAASDEAQVAGDHLDDYVEENCEDA